METFGCSGPRDVGAVIAAALVAGQVQGMLWRWFAFFTEYLSDSLFSTSFVELCGISWRHPRGWRDLQRLAQAPRLLWTLP